MCTYVNLEVFVCGGLLLFFQYIKLIRFWTRLDWILYVAKQCTFACAYINIKDTSKSISLRLI